MNLVLDNITKSFGRQLVLDRVSVSIQGPKVVGLVGRNGQGKSTLLKIIAGIIVADEGQVTNPSNPSASRSISYMAESNPLYGEMYVFEFLQWVAASHLAQSSDTDLIDLAKAMGLLTVVQKRINQLSKGFRQRLGIAGALIGSPTICLLDEPINGLDPAQLIEMRHIIRKHSRDKIILLSSHLMSEIEALCDQVYLLENGTLREVNASSNDIIYKIVLRDRQVPTDFLTKLVGVLHVERKDSYLVVQLENMGALDSVLRKLVEKNIGIRSMYEARYALDELFVNPPAE